MCMLVDGHRHCWACKGGRCRTGSWLHISSVCLKQGHDKTRQWPCSICSACPLWQIVGAQARATMMALFISRAPTRRAVIMRSVAHWMGSCSLQRYSELIRLSLLFVIDRVIMVSHICLLQFAVNSSCLCVCFSSYSSVSSSTQRFSSVHPDHQ